MSGFRAKLAASIAAGFLLVSGCPASYASHPHAVGCDTSPWWIGGARKMVAGRKGNAGCEGLISIYNKKVGALAEPKIRHSISATSANSKWLKIIWH